MLSCRRYNFLSERIVLNTPKVSIVVPIYNGEKYIDNCVKNLKAQTYGNLEFVLVDDGSSDGTRQKCDSYAKEDPRFKVVHKKNSGVSAARNAGTAMAEGDYIVYYDVDDDILPNLVEDNVRLAVQNDADVVIFEFWYHNVDTGRRKSNVLGRGFVGNARDFFYDYLTLAMKHEVLNAQWNKLYRAGFIKENALLFPPQYTIYEDMIFTSLMLKYASKIVVNDNMYYIYNLRRSGTLITRYVDNYFDSVTYYYDNAMDYCDLFEQNMPQKSEFAAQYVRLVTANLKQISCNESLSYDEKIRLISNICSSEKFKSALRIGNLETKKCFVRFFAMTGNAKAIFYMYRLLGMVQK